jgi:hypothetical protein
MARAGVDLRDDGTAKQTSRKAPIHRERLGLNVFVCPQMLLEGGSQRGPTGRWLDPGPFSIDHGTFEPSVGDRRRLTMLVVGYTS